MLGGSTRHSHGSRVSGSQLFLCCVTDLIQCLVRCGRPDLLLQRPKLNSDIDPLHLRGLQPWMDYTWQEATA